MYRQVQHHECVALPTNALTSSTGDQMCRMMDAFLQRKRLFQYHEKLHGVVVNVAVDCFRGCTHQRHVWSLAPDAHYVHVPCTYHASVLMMKPGERFTGTVKHMRERGLVFTAQGFDVEFLVHKDRPGKRGLAASTEATTTTPTVLNIEPRPIPDSLWRPGAFAMLVFEGVTRPDGPCATIDPAFVEAEAEVQAPDQMVSDASELLFALDAMAMGSSSSSSSSSSNSSSTTGGPTASTTKRATKPSTKKRIRTPPTTTTTAASSPSI
jgi:hypothetical protein